MNEVESRRGNREQREKGNVGVDLSFTATLPPLLQSLEGQLPISGDKEADRLEDSSMRIWSSEERKGAQGCNPDAHRTPVVFDESEAVSVWLCVSVCVLRQKKKVQDYFRMQSPLAVYTATNPQRTTTIAKGRDKALEATRRRKRRRYSSSRSLLSGSANKHYIIQCTEHTQPVFHFEES